MLIMFLDLRCYDLRVRSVATNVDVNLIISETSSRRAKRGVNLFLLLLLFFLRKVGADVLTLVNTYA